MADNRARRITATAARSQATKIAKFNISLRKPGYRPDQARYLINRHGNGRVTVKREAKKLD